MIDWNFRVGDLAVILSLAGTCILYAFKSGKFAESIENMQEEIRAMKEVAKSISAVLTTVATQKVEIEHLRDDVREMKHGDGFVQGRRFGSIDREYP